jgi:voltage-gated potassium channel
MTPTSSRLDRWFDRVDESVAGGRTPELARYTRRYQTPIDLVALCTIWLTVMPFSTQNHEYYELWLAARLGLSGLFAVDLIIRTRLSGLGLRYVAAHPLAPTSVLFPPVRVLLSLRLLRRMFSRGNLGQFLFVASMLILNGAIIVWAFERSAPGATITTMGDSLWWAIVTVTTVGYGDYSPVTTVGRFVAAAVMILGVVVLAVVTANVAASFRDQAPATAGGTPGQPGATGPQPSSIEDLAATLSALQQQLQQAAGEPHVVHPGTDPASGRPSTPD